ncbi:MAG: hypothetical protein ACREQF_07970 [Candidatus Binataceae bacterium]
MKNYDKRLRAAITRVGPQAEKMIRDAYGARVGFVVLAVPLDEIGPSIEMVSNLPMADAFRMLREFIKTGHGVPSAVQPKEIA